jgi:hypothetical protein
LARLQGLISGLQKHFPNGSLTFGNATYTTASLVQTLQSLANGIAAVNAARASAKDAVAKLATIEPSVALLVQDLTRFIEATFGAAAQELADFGLQPPKAKKQLTSAELTAKAVKAAATRKARGTAGKNQKAAVKGNVTAVEITPVTTPANTSAPAQPATTTTIAAPAQPAGPAATK